MKKLNKIKALSLICSLLLTGMPQKSFASTGPSWVLPPANLSVTIAESSGTVATATAANTAGIVVGMTETFTGASIGGYNGVPYVVQSVTPTTFTFNTATALGTPSGTITTSGDAPIYVATGVSIPAQAVGADGVGSTSFSLTNSSTSNHAVITVGGISVNGPADISPGLSGTFTSGQTLIYWITGHSSSNTASVTVYGGNFGKP